MIWNWDPRAIIVFSWWTTTSYAGLLFSSFLVVLISLLHELVGYYQAQRDRDALAHEVSYASLAAHGVVQYQTPGRVQRALLYGMRTYLTILLMLIMMTFNGYLIISIIVGAIIGHYMLGQGAAHH